MDHHRWYLLDGDVVGDGYTTLCYVDDELVKAVHFDDRIAATVLGDEWIHTESPDER